MTYVYLCKNNYLYAWSRKGPNGALYMTKLNFYVKFKY